MDRATATLPSAADLRQSYRAAFQAFAERQKRVQQLTNLIEERPEAPPGLADELELAVVEMERARMEYSRRRDLLAVQLLGEGSLVADGFQGQEISTEQQVRIIAQLLWESAGRPEGTAQNDWFRAERIAAEAAVVAA